MGLQTGRPARNSGYQTAQFFAQRVTFDGSSGISYTQDRDGLGAGIFYLGKVPAFSIIIPALTGVDVNTVFNAGTNNRLNIGISGTAAKYGSVLTLATLGFAPIAVAVGHRVLVDTDIIVTIDVTGTAPTTGDIELLLGYRLPN